MHDRWLNYHKRAVCADLHATYLHCPSPSVHFSFPAAQGPVIHVTPHLKSNLSLFNLMRVSCYFFSLNESAGPKKGFRSTGYDPFWTNFRLFSPQN